MTLKCDAKFEEKLIYCFKINKKLVNFDLSTRNSQNFHFDWFLLRIVYNVWPKKVQRSNVSWHWRVVQNLKENWLLVWKNDMRNLVNLYQSTQKSQNWDFDGFLLSKVENVWALNHRGVMCHDNEEPYKIRRGIDLLFQIWHHNLTNFDPSTQMSHKFAF